MKLFEARKAVTSGKRIRRIDWNDGSFIWAKEVEKMDTRYLLKFSTRLSGDEGPEKFYVFFKSTADTIDKAEEEYAGNPNYRFGRLTGWMPGKEDEEADWEIVEK